jgi:hypothetical protein
MYFRNCSTQEICQEKSVTVDLEVVSVRPRVFVIDNFLSDFEADEIVRLSSKHLRHSEVGDAACIVCGS